MKTRHFLGLALASLCALPFTAASGEFPKDSPKFVTSYRKLLSQQKETSKPAIVVFSASWCGPCKAMKKDVYPSAAVKPFHDKFVWAYLDADDTANKKAMEKYAVSGIPHIEFLDPAGESIGQQVGGNTPEAFAKKLEEMLAKAGPATKADPAPEKKAAVK